MIAFAAKTKMFIEVQFINDHVVQHQGSSIYQLDIAKTSPQVSRLLALVDVLNELEYS
jgi:hypothetical protein